MRKNSYKIAIFMTEDWVVDNLMKRQLNFLTKYFKVTIITSKTNKKLFYFNKKIKLIYIKIYRRIKIIKDLITLVKYYRVIKKNDIDLLIFSTPKCIAIHGIASFFLKIKSIMIVRGCFYENYTGIKRKFFEFFDFLGMLNSHRILFISNSLMSFYLKNNILKLFHKKYNLIGKGSSNGFDFKYSKNRKIINFNKQKNKLKLCYVGRICSDKGIQDIIDISRKLYELSILKRLTLIGDEETNFQNFLNEQPLKFLKLIQKKKFKKNILNEMTKHDLLLFPSRREGFGNVCVEATIAGIPVFSYNINGIKDSVKNNVSGILVKPFNKSLLLSKILKFYNGEITFNSNLALKWAESKFSHKIVWNSYLKNFHNVINEK